MSIDGTKNVDDLVEIRLEENLRCCKNSVLAKFPHTMQEQHRQVVPGVCHLGAAVFLPHHQQEPEEMLALVRPIAKQIQYTVVLTVTVQVWAEDLVQYGFILLPCPSWGS
jgi:hypothetical protein